MTKNLTHRTTQPQVFIEQGKLPPQALDMEAAVLGSLMLEMDAATDVMDICRAEYFYKPENGIIFEAIYQLFNEGHPIDILTVTNKLRELGKLEEIGGAYYISQLTNRIAGTANVEMYVRIVQQNYIKREIIRECHVATKRSYDETEDPFDILDEMGVVFEKQLDSVCERQEQSAFELSTQTFKSIMAKRDNKEKGIYTGFSKIDNQTGGFIDGNLVVIAARPGMGKTALALTFADNIARQKKHVLFFSLEMDNEELMKRLLSMQTGISANRMNTLNLHDQDYANIFQGVEIVAKFPMYFDDSPNVRLSHIRARAKKLHRQGKLDIIFLDYIQLMDGDRKGNENRTEEVGRISGGLKRLAKELKVPIVALSQLSREVEKRADKRPQLSDLRESGSIEQDADIVIFIYRPEMYDDEKRIETKYGMMDPDGIACIDFAKHRSGATFDTHLRFVKHQTKFIELEDPFQSTHQQPYVDPNKNFEPNKSDELDTSNFPF
jgi:replicative DNA helicase